MCVCVCSDIVMVAPFVAWSRARRRICRNELGWLPRTLGSCISLVPPFSRQPFYQLPAWAPSQPDRVRRCRKMHGSAATRTGGAHCRRTGRARRCRLPHLCRPSPATAATGRVQDGHPDPQGGTFQ